MLFLALILWIVGYSMVYAVLHGKWQFWQYWYPGGTANAAPATPAAPAAAAVA